MNLYMPVYEQLENKVISLSVESTLHTLNRIFDSWKTSDDVPDLPENIRDFDGYGLYGNLRVFYLSQLRALSVNDKVPNDELKYYLPEFWPTDLILTSNIRELRHILNLRTNPAALKICLPTLTERKWNTKGRWWIAPPIFDGDAIFSPPGEKGRLGDVVAMGITNKADAILIAEAPVMYDLLKETLRYFSEYDIDSQLKYDIVYCLLRADDSPLLRIYG